MHSNVGESGVNGVTGHKQASVDIPRNTSFDMICDAPDTGQYCSMFGYIARLYYTGVAIDNTLYNTQTRSCCSVETRSITVLLFFWVLIGKPTFICLSWLIKG